jgi:hypothetical protein
LVAAQAVLLSVWIQTKEVAEQQLALLLVHVYVVKAIEIAMLNIVIEHPFDLLTVLSGQSSSWGTLLFIKQRSYWISIIVQSFEPIDETMSCSLLSSLPDPCRYEDEDY